MAGRRISLPVKLAFGFGQLAESMYLGLFIAFSAIYYNQAVGLSNSLIGLATMIALFWDAIIDPVVGSLSDRWRSRLGRRHPFLLIAPIPLGLSLYFLFQPPAFMTEIAPGAQVPDQLPLFLWMAAWTVIGRTFLTFYSVPHLALGAELSDDYDERSSIFSFNAVFGFFFGASVGYVAYSYFFLGERIRASDGVMVPGHLDPAAYGPLMLFAAAAIVIGVYVCALVTLRELPYLSKAPPEMRRFSPLGMFTDMLSALTNRHYMVLLIAFFCLSLTIGIGETVGTFLGTYFWELLPAQLRWFGLAHAGGFVAGALSTPFLIALSEKRTVCVASISVATGLIPLMVLGRMLGIMPANGDPLLLPILLTHGALGAFCLGALNVCVMSMLADVADQHELESGRRQEGMFYSARLFFAKAANSLSHLLAGLALDFFVVFPFNAVPGAVDDGVLFRLGLVAGPFAAIGAAVAIVFYGKYQLSREDHAVTRAALDQRKATAAE